MSCNCRSKRKHTCFQCHKITWISPDFFHMHEEKNIPLWDFQVVKLHRSYGVWFHGGVVTNKAMLVVKHFPGWSLSASLSSIQQTKRSSCMTDKKETIFVLSELFQFVLFFDLKFKLMRILKVQIHLKCQVNFKNYLDLIQIILPWPGCHSAVRNVCSTKTLSKHCITQTSFFLGLLTWKRCVLAKDMNETRYVFVEKLYFGTQKSEKKSRL